MQVTETIADGLKREYTITVPAGDLEQEITRRLGEIGRQVRLPGFRPGKVPMQILRTRFGPSVRGEVLQSTLQASSAEAISERQLRPALPPKVDILSADEGADLEYKMAVEVLPEIPEPSFADLGIERLVVEVPDEEVDQAIARIAEQQRKSEAVERPQKLVTSCSSIPKEGLATRRSRAPVARIVRSSWARAARFRASRTSWSVSPPANTVRSR